MYGYLYASVTDVDAYLQRIRAESGRPLDKEYLDALIYSHQCSIVFENLDICEFHRPISLGIADIYHKVVEGGRGGYCFELNALFTQLLKDLGYTAHPCMCRIVRGRDFTPPVLHRGIIVLLEGRMYFCDVGYGGPMPPGSVLVQDGHSETLHGETFHIREKDSHWWVLSRTTSAGVREDVMEFYTMPQENVDFLALNEYCSKSEASVFTQKHFVNVRTPSGSKSILGDIFTCVEHEDTVRRTIAGPDEFYQILECHFGIFIRPHVS